MDYNNSTKKPPENNLLDFELEFEEMNKNKTSSSSNYTQSPPQNYNYITTSGQKTPEQGEKKNQETFSEIKVRIQGKLDRDFNV